MEDITYHLRCLPVDCDGTCYTCQAANEIIFLRNCLAATKTALDIIQRTPNALTLTAQSEKWKIIAEQLAEALESNKPLTLASRIALASFREIKGEEE